MDHSPGFLAYVEGKRPNVREVSVDETVRATRGDSSARLFDVREDHEFTARHAAGAEHVSRGVLERDIERLVPDKGTPLYLYCGGGFRSTLAADALQQMGYTAVHSVAGGWRAWEGAGAPTEGPEAAARIRVTDLEQAADALERAGASVERVHSDGAGNSRRVHILTDDGNVVELWQAAP